MKNLEKVAHRKLSDLRNHSKPDYKLRNRETAGGKGGRARDSRPPAVLSNSFRRLTPDCALRQ